MVQSQSNWPSDAQLSGNAFLPTSLKTLQNDPGSSPVSLWLDRGALAWSDSSTGASCTSCHGKVNSLREAVVRHPRLSADGTKLVNLEDQILKCRSQSGKKNDALESEEVLALSALLHQTAKDLTWQLQAPINQQVQWQTRLEQGTALYAQRMGRMNLACVHCHDQNIGKQMRADVISPAHPTGFPIYRMSWQGMGSIDRRLRACYSGVQAQLPLPGDPALRDLELFLKVRASGIPLDGPSLRR
jgi:sulfur-oxidizing protein SoxA